MSAPPADSVTQKKEKITISQQVRNAITAKLDAGYELRDKSSVDELGKTVCDQLKIKYSSWNSKIKKMIKDEAVKRNIQISDLGFNKNKIGDMSLTVIKNEVPKEEPQLKPNVETVSSPHGTLPKITSHDSANIESPHGTLPNENSDVPQEEPVLSTSAQERLISDGLTKIVLPIYQAMGIVEGDDSDEITKPKKAKKARDEFEGLAKDLNEFLNENDIHLPAFLKYVSIGVSIFAVMILPVIQFKLFGQNSDAKPEYDDAEIEVKV